MLLQNLLITFINKPCKSKSTGSSVLPLAISRADDILDIVCMGNIALMVVTSKRRVKFHQRSLDSSNSFENYSQKFYTHYQMKVDCSFPQLSEKFLF